MTTATSDLLPGYWVDPVTGAWCSLPWPTDPDEKMALVRASLGPQLIEWAEGRTDEPGLTNYMTGEPWRWTAGQKRFLILWYHVQEDGRFTYRSGIKRGAKGTGKDPMAGAMCNTELRGPVEMYDWDEKTGRPVARPRGFPLVQVMSNSEQQSRDVLRVANAMWSREAREFYDLDCGDTRTVLRSNGGRFEIPPSSEASGEGDPATFVALNESHHMTENSGGSRVAAMGRRNVAKSPAVIQARLCEFTNAHRQGGGSVAEASFAAWQAQHARGYRGKQDILYDSIEAPPDTEIFTHEGRLAGLRAAYMDAEWGDIERLSDEMQDQRTSVADTIRYYLNGLATAEDAWADPLSFDAMARPSRTLAEREQIALFLDCSKSGDSTPLVGVTMTGEHVVLFDVWAKPHGWDEKRHGPWLVPRAEVDARVRQVLDQYTPMWFGVDPSPATDADGQASYWMPLIDDWHRDYKNLLPNWATPGAKGHAVLFDMRMSQPGGLERLRMFTATAEQTATDINGEDGETEVARAMRLADPAFAHDGDSTLRAHVHNARQRPNAFGISLGKQTRDSHKLVDAAVGLVGARMGRRIALNSGKKPAKKRRSGEGRRVVVFS